jgi:hypothetical protein
LASSENTLDLDLDGDDPSAFGGDLDLGTGSPIASELPFALLRRELRWFYVRMRGRVPAVGDAPAREVVAASRIAGWLSELWPMHRGAFVVRYDGRRWPVRLLRKFGGLTSVAVRFAAMGRRRGPTETLAESEQAAVAQLLADIAAAARPPDLTPRGALAMKKARKLRRLQRAAQVYVRQAERAYFEARAGAPCAVPSSKEGA